MGIIEQQLRSCANAINEYPDDSLPGAYGRDIANYRQNIRLVYYGYFLPSEVAENLLEFWWDTLDLNAKREEAVLWSKSKHL